VYWWIPQSRKRARELGRYDTDYNNRAPNGHVTAEFPLTFLTSNVRTHFLLLFIYINPDKHNPSYNVAATADYLIKLNWIYERDTDNSHDL